MSKIKTFLIGLKFFTEICSKWFRCLIAIIVLYELFLLIPNPSFFVKIFMPIAGISYALHPILKGIINECYSPQSKVENGQEK